MRELAHWPGAGEPVASEAAAASRRSVVAEIQRPRAGDDAGQGSQLATFTRPVLRPDISMTAQSWSRPVESKFQAQVVMIG